MSSMWQRRMVVAVVAIGFAPLALAAGATAQDGTLARRTVTFRNTPNATLRFQVPAVPFPPQNTIFLLEFGKDGSAAVVNPGLGSGVSFTLKLGSTTLPFTVAALPIANDPTFTGKEVSVIQPDASGTPGLFAITINYTVATSASETWELEVTGLPTGGTPAVRAIASVTGNTNGFTLLTPTAVCAGGGGSTCPVCPVCPNRVWWIPEVFFVPINFCPRCPPPPCLTCPLDWRRPPDRAFERTLVQFVAYDSLDNPLGPGRAQEIRVNISGGEPLGGVLDAGNSEYLQLIQHPRGEPPRISVTAAGAMSREVLAAPEREGEIYRALTWLLGILLAIAVAAMMVMWRRFGRARGATSG